MKTLKECLNYELNTNIFENENIDNKMKDNIIKKIIEYNKTFKDLGINTYINYDKDNPTNKFFEPLCKYFNCEPIYDFNGLYYSTTCVKDINLYDNDFSIHVKLNGKSSDTDTENFRFIINIKDMRLVSSFFDTLDRIIAHYKKQVEINKNVSVEELWKILEISFNKKIPKGGSVKTMFGKKGNDNNSYKALVVSETNRMIDQLGSATCGKLLNGKIFMKWSSPLGGTTTYEYKTLSDYKKAMENFVF